MRCISPTHSTCQDDHAALHKGEAGPASCGGKVHQFPPGKPRYRLEIVADVLHLLLLQANLHILGTRRTLPVHAAGEPGHGALRAPDAQ